MTSLYRILADRDVPRLAHSEIPPHPGSFNPVGIMLHHTKTAGPALNVIRKGRSDLEGPLANLNITRSGGINVTCDGIAWHAGKGSGKVLNEVMRDVAPSDIARARHLTDDTNGNSHFYGIEVDNDGVGELYPKAQINSILLCCLALMQYHNWPSVNRIIHHKEWTSRKVDMSYKGDVRRELSDLIKFLGG